MKCFGTNLHTVHGYVRPNNQYSIKEIADNTHDLVGLLQNVVLELWLLFVDGWRMIFSKVPMSGKKNSTVIILVPPRGTKIFHLYLATTLIN